MASSSSARPVALSCIQSVRDYVSKMAADVTGMKVLVMDAETTGIVSMVYTQTQILQHEVFLIDSIERSRPDKMAHLKAIYFVRPTHENIRLLQEEFKDPKYGEYHIFFSNVVREGMIQQLAEADEHEVVQQVQEFYADFLAINPDLVSLGLSNTALTSGGTFDQPTFDRMQQGVCAMLLALKKKPIIRYVGTSEVATRVAESVLATLDQEGDLFAFRKPEVAPLLLVLDRRDDPVTPLLSQWTYQAMVHELIGISNNRVDLRGRPGIPKDLEQVVLSSEQDKFFANNIYSNYGDLAEEVKAMMDDFQAKTKSSKDISSIADMQSFVESYPEFRKFSGDVTKHVTLLGEINRLVSEQSLMEVSQVEQELACNEHHSRAVSDVEELLRKPSIAIANKVRPVLLYALLTPRTYVLTHSHLLTSCTLPHKVRLVLLYALRYEREPANRIAKFSEVLSEQGASSDQLQLIPLTLQHYGAAVRAGDVFGNKSRLTAQMNRVKRGLNGVENVYTQHSPFLVQTLEAVTKGTLSEATHPYLGPELPTTQKKRAPTEIIVFMLGGATYEEARSVGEMNASNPGVKIVLGGSTIHSSDTFLTELSQLSAHPSRLTAPSGGTSSTSWDVSSGLANLAQLAPPNVDRKRIAALTSSVTSTVSSSVQAGVSSAMQKLQ